MSLSAYRRGVQRTLRAAVAYQSALLTTPLALLRILASILQFPSFLRITLTMLLIIPPLYMAYVSSVASIPILTNYAYRWQAYIDAARNGLVRFQIPFIGPLAERWVSEE